MKDWQERSVASLPYLLPLTAVMPLGVYLVRHYSFLLPFWEPLFWLHQFLNFPLLPFISLETVTFFALFSLVVRDGRFYRSVRVHVLQALLLTLVVFLCSLLVRLASLALPLIGEVLANATFLGVGIASVFGLVQGARGTVAELPGITTAAQMQVR
ncbi:MAG: Tic20 family protein [Pseudanabaenaceae cyanobacterium]